MLEGLRCGANEEMCRTKMTVFFVDVDVDVVDVDVVVNININVFRC